APAATRDTPKEAPRAAAPPPAPVPAPAPTSNFRAAPSARQLAADQNIDLAGLRGSGPGGLILKEDVQHHLGDHPPAPASVELPPAAPAPAKAPAARPAERETRQRMSGIRQRIAERLVQAQNTAAILTTFNEADLSQVMALRARYKELFQKKHDVGLGFMSFFVKACIEALRAFPAVNARIEGNDLVFCHYYDIGVAVSTEKGLLVPVLRDADQMSFAEIEKAITALAQKAREGKIGVDDLQGGTFTITNGGVFGSLLSTPILNP